MFVVCIIFYYCRDVVVRCTITKFLILVVSTYTNSYANGAKVIYKLYCRIKIPFPDIYPLSIFTVNMTTYFENLSLEGISSKYFYYNCNT